MHQSYRPSLYGCEAAKLSAQARRKLNGTVSKMLSSITGRTTADEAPQIDARRRHASKRQAVELARPHPPPGRAPGNTTSSYELRQANSGLDLRRVPDLDSRKAAELAAEQ